MRGAFRLCAVGAALLQSSCEPATEARASQLPAERVAERAERARAPARNPERGGEPTAGELVRIPAGVLAVGSTPGSAWRNPSHEADGVPLEIPSFEIDRLPYPNDPAQPPDTGKTRAEAAAACAAQGKRLCDELEWERACKGPDGLTHAGGPEHDVAACRAAPGGCRSGFGVAAMGALGREWTASEAPGGLGHASRTAVLRGGGDAPEGAAHRCAARSGATPDSRADGIAFRCCRGTTPSLSYPEAPEHEPIAELEVADDEIRNALASHAPLAEAAKSFTPFEGRDIDAALRRGGRTRDGISLWTFPPATFAWSPVPGEELWVFNGRTDQGALLALLYPLGDGRFAHAASTLVAEQDATIAVGWNAEYPEQLVWSTCWNCAGAGGIVAFGEDARIRFAYR